MVNGRKKIVWGVLGVGQGHTFRQLPLIEHFSKEALIVIFASQQAHAILSCEFHSARDVHVLEVSPPYYPDSDRGIDFKNVRDLTKNDRHLYMNADSLSRAEELIGSPDLVISDYEAISAMYAYAHNARLITIDQQSKYLFGDFPEIPNLNPAGEQMRLNMFFPKAHARISCSFFNITRSKNASQDVQIHPPILRESIIGLRNDPVDDRLLVYLSGVDDYKRPLQTIEDYIRHDPSVRFSIFAQNITRETTRHDRVSLHEPEQDLFTKHLGTCQGIICTAGHTLVSEAMYLGIPVLALPRQQYEAHVVARAIADNGFGHTEETLTAQGLHTFTQNLGHYRKTIHADEKVLLRRPGQHKIIQYISDTLNKADD